MGEGLEYLPGAVQLIIWDLLLRSSVTQDEFSRVFWRLFHSTQIWSRLLFFSVYFFIYLWYGDSESSSDCVASNSRKVWCDFDHASSLTCGNKMPTRCNRGFIADLISCSTCFGHHYAHHQELVWCGAEGYVSGHITLSSTPDQQLENHSTKYHRQQPMYNTPEPWWWA